MNTIQEFANTYNQKSYSHKYIAGFEYKNSIYAFICHIEELKDAMVIDIASAKNGGGKVLKYAPKKAYKENMVAKCDMVMSTAEFETMVKNSKYNRGEIFEKIITEQYGQKWEKDNVPFHKGGDIVIDDTPYQIKFQKATFCSEKQLAKI